MIREYRLAIPQDRLSDLKERLAKTLWPSEIENSGWSYGANLQTIGEFCEYWAATFDWRAWEARLNAQPQFVASLDDVEIHFLHIASRNKQAFPLLLTHGWPSSVFEYLKINPLLRDDFSLVIPSLPGHGPAAPTPRPGLSIYEVARLWHQLILGSHLSYLVGGLTARLGPKVGALTQHSRCVSSGGWRLRRLQRTFCPLGSQKLRKTGDGAATAPLSARGRSVALLGC